MKNKIIALNNEHLLDLISEELKLNGVNCDLNHIDVSNIRGMQGLFAGTSFNGDISQWNTSNVDDMSGMFYCSKFNGNISNWNTSKVSNMERMFAHSDFNGDISKWDTSSLRRMSLMFYKSDFNGDLSKWNVSITTSMSGIFEESKFSQDLSMWKPYDLIYDEDAFKNCLAPIPFWMEYDSISLRKKAIDHYALYREIKNEISDAGKSSKKIKI